MSEQNVVSGAGEQPAQKGGAAAAAARAAIEQAKAKQQEGATAQEGAAQPAATKERKSLKSKEALGVPNDHTVTWPPIALSPADNELVTKAAAGDGKKLTEFLRAEFEGQIKNDGPFRSRLQELAAKAPAPKEKAADKLPEDPEEAIKVLEQRASKIAEAQKRATELLEQARQRLAANGAAKTETPAA